MDRGCEVSWRLEYGEGVREMVSSWKPPCTLANKITMSLLCLVLHFNRVRAHSALNHLRYTLLSPRTYMACHWRIRGRVTEVQENALFQKHYFKIPPLSRTLDPPLRVDLGPICCNFRTELHISESVCTEN